MLAQVQGLAQVDRLPAATRREGDASRLVPAALAVGAGCAGGWCRRRRRLVPAAPAVGAGEGLVARSTSRPTNLAILGKWGFLAVGTLFVGAVAWLS
jgi:hypothetical protein